VNADNCPDPVDTVWTAEKAEMVEHRPLRGACGHSRNVLPLETGTTRGRPRERGKSRETGPPYGYLAPAGGAQCRPSQATGRLTRRGRARPLHLIHGGALSDLPGQTILARINVAGRRRPGLRPRRSRVMTVSPDEPARSCCTESQGHPGHQGAAPRSLPAALSRPAAREGTAHRPSVQKRVDHLCKTGLSLCTRWGNAGDFAARPRP
jgi:hypothetical protein